MLIWFNLISVNSIDINVMLTQQRTHNICIILKHFAFYRIYHFVYCMKTSFRNSNGLLSCKMCILMPLFGIIMCFFNDKKHYLNCSIVVNEHAVCLLFGYLILCLFGVLCRPFQHLFNFQGEISPLLRI